MHAESSCGPALEASRRECALGVPRAQMAIRFRSGWPRWPRASLLRVLHLRCAQVVAGDQQAVRHRTCARATAAVVGEEAYRCGPPGRSEEHTSELQSLMRISYAVICLKTKMTYPRT